MNYKKLERIYQILRSRFGYLDWWPGETKDEIIIGAILTQNTNWKNVEKAMANLKREDMLQLRKIAKESPRNLERMIRPSGFYRQKAKGLKGFAKYLFSNYKSLDGLLGKEADELKEELLSLKGIGMETADSIMLYAAEKPVFVIDAYTKRIVGRIMNRKKEFGYEELQSLITNSIKEDTALYNDFHAQFVELGKNYCRKEPVCRECPINSLCSYERKSS